jgi:RimJ/RimL family protein N-acetyltransferase
VVQDTPGGSWPLRTPRLDLRPFALEDADALAQVVADAEALRFWGPPLTPEEVRARIERNRAAVLAGDFGRCAIVVQETGELVGDAGLTRTDVEGGDEVELGWIVAPAFWGRGYATEAGAAWRDHALVTLGLHRIVSMIRPENAPSRRVADKLGMRLERTATWNGAAHLVYVAGRAIAT